MRQLLDPNLILFGTLLIGVAGVMVNLVFAIGVFADTARLLDRGRSTKLVPGPMWAFATLLGGVFVATAYWFIHHSTLSADRDQ